MLILKDLDTYVIEQSWNWWSILAIWETWMDFWKDYTDKKYWRFKKIWNVNNDLTGLDINKKNVELAKKDGYNFVYWDIEKVDTLVKLWKKYDLILMIDVIEHLNNVWLALDNVSKILNKWWKLIITTPNPFYFRNFIKLIFKQDLWFLEDHTCFIDENNFKQLVKRIWEYKINKIDYINFIPLNQNIGFLKLFVLKLIKKYNKLFLSNIYVELNNK